MYILKYNVIEAVSQSIPINKKYYPVMKYNVVRYNIRSLLHSNTIHMPYYCWCRFDSSDLLPIPHNKTEQLTSLISQVIWILWQNVQGRFKTTHGDTVNCRL